MHNFILVLANMKSLIIAVILVIVVFVLATLSFLGLPPFKISEVEEVPGTITYPTASDILSAGELIHYVGQDLISRHRQKYS